MSKGSQFDKVVILWKLNLEEVIFQIWNPGKFLSRPDSGLRLPTLRPFHPAFLLLSRILGIAKRQKWWIGSRIDTMKRSFSSAFFFRAGCIIGLVSSLLQKCTSLWPIKKCTSFWRPTDVKTTLYAFITWHNSKKKTLILIHKKKQLCFDWCQKNRYLLKCSVIGKQKQVFTFSDQTSILATEAHFNWQFKYFEDFKPFDFSILVGFGSRLYCLWLLKKFQTESFVNVISPQLMNLNSTNHWSIEEDRIVCVFSTCIPMTLMSMLDMWFMWGLVNGWLIYGCM